MKKIAILLSLALLLIIVPDLAMAKGASFSGGRSFSSVRSTSSFSSTRSFTSTSKPSTTSTFKSTGSFTTPKAPSISKTPTTSTFKVTTPAKVVNGKSYGTVASKVDATYKPTFAGGYAAPAGSMVYYRDTSSSFLNWLPFYMIMTSQSHREAVVVEPAKDGAPAVEKVVKEEGVDTMYVINWIVSILFILGIIALVVYLVNKKTQNSYGY